MNLSLYASALVLSFSLVFSATAGPKYGPKAEPLSLRTNVDYFQKNPAHDFWALMPYYVGQPTGRACGAANLTMVTNAARSMKGLGSDDKLFTVVDFVKNHTDKNYEKTILGNGKFERENVTNRNMARLLGNALQKLKVTTEKNSVQLVNLDPKQVDAGRKLFLNALKQNEKSADDFIVISFIQGTLTGDPEGQAHVATIGGYDEKTGKVLIFDPDRDYYEPYWSPVDAVYDAVRDPKADGENPGWIHVQVRGVRP